MKKQKISLLALAVLAGGITAASAASKTELSATYYMTATNVVAQVVFVEEVPRSLVFQGLQSAGDIVSTDGSGKIEGAAILEFGTPASNGYVRYVTSVTGSVKGKENTTPVVDVKLKGSGYSGLGTNVNGVLELVGTPASLSLAFKSTGPVVTTNNTMAGQFNGTIKSGVPVLDNLTGGGKVKNSAAVVDVDTDNATSFEAVVVQVGNKLSVVSDTPIDAQGTGKVSSNNRSSMSLKGFGSSKGSSWKLDGTSSQIPVVGAGTNTTVTLFSTADVTAKLFGQQFKRTCAVTAELN